MASTARYCLASGVAVVSVGVVSMSSAGLPALEARVSSENYRLAADSSLLNVPVNLFNMVLSMPAWEIQAMERSADAMIGTGSWQVWGPTNVFGFDEWDPPKLAAGIDMLMPVYPFSSVFGDQIGWWAKANFPMNSGCAAAPGACPDLRALTAATLKVSPAQLNEGYQFPAVTNPFTLQQTSWSGGYVTTDPGAAFTALWDYLTAPSAGVDTAPIGDYFRVPVKWAKSMFDAFYPFVQNSEWFDEEMVGPVTASLFKALAPVTCPSCEPGNPYDNPWLYDNYPPIPAASAAVPAPAASVPITAAGTVAAEPVDLAVAPDDAVESNADSVSLASESPRDSAAAAVPSSEAGTAVPATVRPIGGRNLQERSSTGPRNAHSRFAERAGRN